MIGTEVSHYYWHSPRQYPCHLNLFWLDGSNQMPREGWCFAVGETAFFFENFHLNCSWLWSQPLLAWKRSLKLQFGVSFRILVWTNGLTLTYRRGVSRNFSKVGVRCRFGSPEQWNATFSSERFVPSAFPKHKTHSGKRAYAHHLNKATLARARS